MKNVFPAPRRGRPPNLAPAMPKAMVGLDAIAAGQLEILAKSRFQTRTALVNMIVHEWLATQL